MNYTMIKRHIAAKQKGAFMSCVWEKQLPTLKAFSGEVITKRTRGLVRTGIEYDNIAAVKEARATGTAPVVNAGLPWGEWLEYPYLIGHKGAEYLRVARVNGSKFTTEYFHNGRRVDRAAIENMCQKSAFSDRPMSEVFTINTENIISIH